MALRPVRALFVLLICLGLLCPLFGCGSQDEGRKLVTPQDHVKQIENNPSMSPEQKAEAIANYRAHQQTAASIGNARQKTLAKPPQ
jgi:hypothetical protein